MNNKFNGIVAVSLVASVSCLSYAAQRMPTYEAIIASASYKKVELNGKLFDAIFKKNRSQAKKLIQDGADVNAQYYDNFGSNPPVMPYAFNSGERISGDSPLMLAARYGQRKLVQDFIKAGAKLDARNSFGDTAIKVSKNSKIVHDIANAWADLQRGR